MENAELVFLPAETKTNLPKTRVIFLYQLERLSRENLTRQLKQQRQEQQLEEGILVSLPQAEIKEAAETNA